MKNNIMALGFVMVLLLLAFSYAAVYGQGESPQQEIVVQATESLQGVINSAAPGSVLVLASGTYIENIVIGKSLSIICREPKGAILESKEIGMPVVRIEGSGISVHLENLHIQKAFGHECTKEYPEWICQDGVSISGLATVTLTNLKITDNARNGVGIYNNADVTIEDSSISTNQTGIEARGGPHVQIKGCKLESNSSTALTVWLDAVVVIENTNMSANMSGLLVDGAQMTGTNLMIEDNDYFGLWVEGDSRVTLNNSELQSNKIGILLKDKVRVTLQSCKIEMQYESGIQCSDRSSLTLTSSEVSSNDSHGIEISGKVRVRIIDSTIDLNGHNGLQLAGTPLVTISGSEIADNDGWGVFTCLTKCGWITDDFQGRIKVSDDTVITGNTEGDMCIPD